jgi:hypothetical protein
MSDGNSTLPSGPSDWDISSYQGFIAETVAFALYCALFLYTMIKWRKVNQSTPLFVITIVLFLTCAAHYGTTVYPVAIQNISVNGLTNLSTFFNVPYWIITGLLFSLANLLGDITMIYRLWNFYKKRYLITVLPTLLSLTGFVLAVVNNILLVSGPDAQPAISSDTSTQLNTASYVCPLLTNLFVTGFITGRIWIMVKRQGDETMSTPARRAVATIIESGLLFFLIQLVLTVVNALELIIITPVAFVAVQIYGIAPTLITAGINSGILFTSKGGIPSVTGPLATTHINVNKDSYVMTHLSNNWSEFDQESRRDNDGKSLASTGSVEKL